MHRHHRLRLLISWSPPVSRRQRKTCFEIEELQPRRIEDQPDIVPDAGTRLRREADDDA
jgi:hypothetical protein